MINKKVLDHIITWDEKTIWVGTMSFSIIFDQKFRGGHYNEQGRDCLLPDFIKMGDGRLSGCAGYNIELWYMKYGNEEVL